MSLDPDEDAIRILAVPLDEISPEEWRELKRCAINQDWKGLRDVLVKASNPQCPTCHLRHSPDIRHAS